MAEAFRNIIARKYTDFIKDIAGGDVEIRVYSPFGSCNDPRFHMVKVLEGQGLVTLRYDMKRNTTYAYPELTKDGRIIAEDLIQSKVQKS